MFIMVFVNTFSFVISASELMQGINSKSIIKIFKMYNY